jgi:DtxR family Mn-dependent transcriptional regulator
MLARSVNGTVTLDGVAVPPGVAQHLFVDALDEDLTPAEAAAQL